MVRRTRSVLLSISIVVLLGAASAPALAGPAPPPDRPDAVSTEDGQLAFRIQHGMSHASGQRPELGPHQRGNPTSSVPTLRIGLRYSFTPTGARSEFFSFHHPSVEVTGTAGAFHVVDLSTGDRVVTGRPGDIVSVAHDGSEYVVTDPGGTTFGVEGPVRFRSTSADNTFRVPSIERLNIETFADWLTPAYRGELEVARGTQTPAGMVNLVNEIGLEDYVQGVVINESPAFFHAEALAAQAITARGYAVANIGRFTAQGYPFDLDDSTLSQVYRGQTAEHPNGNAAVERTTGLVASYDGEIISAFYSSSMGGHPENVEWSFGSVGDPGQALPYLVGRYDGPPGTEPDLGTEEGRRAFWASEQPQVYDSQESSGNSRNRWTYTLSREQAESDVDARSAAAEVISGSSTTIGQLESCDITLRSPTGRAMVIRCTGSAAVWQFTGWDDARRLFPHPSLGVLNNPAFLDHEYAADGTLATITVIGGGWGHNVGMSQWGAHGRGRAGQTFGEIITFYYKDTVVGSYPIDLQVQPGAPPVQRQEFATVDGEGVLQIRDAQGLRGLTITINDEHTIDLTAEDLSDPLLELDIGSQLSPGVNVIQYNPRGLGGSATVLVHVYPTGTA